MARKAQGIENDFRDLESAAGVSFVSRRESGKQFPHSNHSLLSPLALEVRVLQTRAADPAITVTRQPKSRSTCLWNAWLHPLTGSRGSKHAAGHLTTRSGSTSREIQNREMNSQHERRSANKAREPVHTDRRREREDCGKEPRLVPRTLEYRSLFVMSGDAGYSPR